MARIRDNRILDTFLGFLARHTYAETFLIFDGGPPGTANTVAVRRETSAKVATLNERSTEVIRHALADPDHAGICIYVISDGIPTLSVVGFSKVSEFRVFNVNAEADALLIRQGSMLLASHTRTKLKLILPQELANTKAVGVTSAGYQHVFVPPPFV